MKPMGESLGKYLSFLESLVRPDAEIRAYEEARALDVARESADARNVPAAADIRAWCLRSKISGDAADAVAGALAWRRKKGPRTSAVLFLLGRTGTRKTVALSHAVVHHTQGAHYTTARELLRNREYEAKEAYHKARNTDLLALDEIGDEPDPSALVSLVLERWTRGGLTLLAGNIEAEALVDRYFKLPEGIKLADRLRGQRKNGLRAHHSISDKESSR